MAKRLKYQKTQAEYAEDYGCTARSIRTYMDKGYPLDDPEKMQAVFAGQKNKPKKAGSGLELDPATLTNEQLENPRNEAEAKLFERILICRKLAHQVDEQRRNVIPKDEVKNDLARIGANLKSVLLGLPGQLPALSGKSAAEMQKWGFGWVHEILTDFSSAEGSLYK